MAFNYYFVPFLQVKRTEFSLHFLEGPKYRCDFSLALANIIAIS